MSTTIDTGWATEAFRQLSRDDDHKFMHLLEAFEKPVVLDESRTTVRTHFLAHDANGEPVVQHLARAMATFVVDFAVPRAKIAKAYRTYEETGSTDAIAALTHEARSLFVPSESSGEGGELLLFMLMERTLDYPQLLSKFPLKTNQKMHVHGSDGVHAKLNDDGVLDLYWGESKFWASSSKAIKDCFDSIAPFLNPADPTARKRDLLLLREHLNIADEKLAAHLIRYFDDDNPEAIKVRWNGVCLVGFDVDAYPNPQTAAEAELKEVAEQVARWHKALLGRVAEHKLLSVSIDIFCLPLPSVSDIRKAVNKALGVTT